VNPRHAEIGGFPVHPSVPAIGEPVDVAWIGLPAAQAADAVRECGQAGVPFAIVLGAGFAETGVDGEAEQARLRAAARETGLRLCGPNGIGFLNAWDRVALTFSTAAELPALHPGPVALLSQSGGLGGCLVNRAADGGLGVGLFVSTGNEADLTLADYLEWLVDDGRARAVGCLVETVRAPERFAAAVGRARERGVAVVALKLGRSSAGARAARSHTGALVGARATWEAWSRAVGLLEVAEPDQLIATLAYLAEALPRGGNRVAMVTSSGGVAVLLADALEPRGFVLGTLGEAIRQRVAALLPPYATVANPVDVTAGLPDETFGRVLEAVMADPDVDVVVVPLTMAATDGGRARAAEIVQAVRRPEAPAKPVVVCWPSGTLVAGGVATLVQARVPLFASADDCAAALGAALDRRRQASGAPGPSGGEAVVRVAPPARGGVLDWAEVRRLLVASGIRVADEVVVDSEAAARSVAARLAYPVAVKLVGPLHKTEVGGVRLGVADDEGLVASVSGLLRQGGRCLVQPMIEGVEALVGAVRDPVLGAFVVLAPGGVRAELYGERAMRPAPVDAAGAEGMIAECRALAALLAGYRGGRPADRRALVDALVRLSVLAAALSSRLVELDLNPIIVGEVGATVVDARIVLEETPDEPRNRLPGLATIL
jgi:acyl-CoA synthetase (NDP forming)